MEGGHGGLMVRKGPCVPLPKTLSNVSYKNLLN
jgi:hypothetical protein